MNIDIKKLSITLGNNKILNDVDLNVKEGSFTGLIGPNGSGKSTLLKTIYRNIKAPINTIYMDKEDIVNISAKESAKKLSVLSQQSNVDFDFSVLDMVMMGRTPYKKLLESNNKEDYDFAKEALRKTGMQGYEERSFNTLSGGEKQRVLLSRALCQNTECMILDEPTNHLDIKHQLEILKLIKDEGLTVFSAIHDLNFALMFCDNIIALKEGRVIASGKTLDIIKEELIKELFGVSCIINKTPKSVSVTFLPPT